MRSSVTNENNNSSFFDTQHTIVRVKWPRQDRQPREELQTARNGNGRIYSVISLNNEWIVDPDMRAIDRAISGGEALHEVFVRNGFSVRKNILDVYTISLSTALTRKFNTVQPFGRAVNAEYIVRKGETIYCYGIVKQIYSPEFWSPVITDKDRTLVNFSFSTLQSCGFSRQEIWQLIDDNPSSWFIDHQPGTL